MDWQFEEDNPLTRGFQHLHIPVDDVEDENLIKWFPRSNAFVQAALKSDPTNRPAATAESPKPSDDDHPGNGVLIHW